jgi:ribose transport system substrate-binding protein
MKRDPYLIKSVCEASRLIAAFQSPGEILRQHQLVERTGLTRGIVHRLLYTLVKEGIIDKPAPHQYRCFLHLSRRTKWKIGFGEPGIHSTFVRDVSQGLRVAVGRCEELELFALDHQYKARVAIANSELFIAERMDLVIEYQIDEHAAHIAAERYREKNIPVIAVNNPYPGATYYGANNYEAGLIGGRYLGRWAKEKWGGEIGEIVMVEVGRAGSIPKSRLSGMVRGVCEVLGDAADKIPVAYIDGDGQFEPTWGAMRKHLRGSRARRVLIGTMNDGSALGVMRAFEEAGRLDDCAVMGQNGSADARFELRRPHTRLIGSVAYFPETYGAGLVRLALDILNRRFVPPAVFTRHLLLTPSNVDHVYPNDALIQPPIVPA